MAIEHVDVLIVGAGLSGIGAACHLQHDCPGKTYAILEGRDAIGGTWDLFRYPGIRSDSRHVHARLLASSRGRDAEGDRRRAVDPAYVRETAREYGIDAHIRFGHRVERAELVERGRALDGARRERGAGERDRRASRCNFLFMCSGYYDYAAGYTPELRRRERFAGRIVHPQHWPDDLDYAGKRVVVIGSGATAVTLVPALAEDGRARDDAPALADVRRRRARRATRSPTGCARVLPAALGLRAHALEERAPRHGSSSSCARRRPTQAKKLLRRLVAQGSSAPGYDVDDALHAALQPLGPAPLPRARRRPLRRDPQRQGLRRHRPRSRRSPRPASGSRSGEELDGRHRRHRDRPQAAARSAACSSTVDGAPVEPPKTHDLQGHDAQRRAQPGARRSATPTRRGR